MEYFLFDLLYAEYGFTTNTLSLREFVVIRVGPYNYYPDFLPFCCILGIARAATTLILEVFVVIRVGLYNYYPDFLIFCCILGIYSVTTTLILQ